MPTALKLSFKWVRPRGRSSHAVGAVDVGCQDIGLNARAPHRTSMSSPRQVPIMLLLAGADILSTALEVPLEVCPTCRRRQLAPVQA